MPDSATNSGSTEIRDRTPIAVKADNIIRQRLRIGNPNDPREVAEGLMRRFPKDAWLLTAETEGFSLSPGGVTTPVMRAPESLATGSEIKAAVDNVARDLQALVRDHRIKGIGPELRGWEQAIHGIIADGTAAARLALDPLARDRLFAARRELCNYARMARLVGALTQAMNADFRGLARSLDVAAGLLLVLAGEVLAGAGLGGGRFLLSVPATELQARRDAVLLALRTLVGTAEQAYGNDQWPWGLHGLREILRAIENSGHLDLRALLEEQVLGTLMDQLIERAAQQDINSLRALGATADIAVERLHRLISIIYHQGRPGSDAPAVTTFLKALQLFLDAFTASKSGYRIMFVARAPIGIYGLTGNAGPDPATTRLIELVFARGRIAELLDCYLGCDCCADDVMCQIVLDKLLRDIDEAVGLYVLGNDTSGTGEPEKRAVAFALLIDMFLKLPVQTTAAAPVGQPSPTGRTCLQNSCFARVKELSDLLTSIVALLRKPFPSNFPTAPDDIRLLTGELCMQQLAEGRLKSLLATMTPGCVEGGTVITAISDLIERTIRPLSANRCTEIEITPPPTKEESLAFLHKLDLKFGL
jgi:hypothetical protein